MSLFRVISFFLIMSVSVAFAEQATQAGAGTLSGKVMTKEKTPMSNGMVLLFNQSMGPPPHIYNYWRIPDHNISTGQNGVFSIDLPEGTYYLLIAQKSSDSEIGPPDKDVFIYFHKDKEGNASPLTIETGKKLELGTLSTDFLWSVDKIEREKGITSASGVVVDDSGKPVKNVLVFANLFREAAGRPVFVSDRTGNDGKFIVRFAEGGTYFLKVRGVMGGGKPLEGEFMSFEPTMISVKKNEKLKDIRLKVNMVKRAGFDPAASSEKEEKVSKKLQELKTVK